MEALIILLAAVGWALGVLAYVLIEWWWAVLLGLGGLAALLFGAFAWIDRRLS